MKLPELDKAEKYTGLYVVDFGEYSSVGFTAEEVAELLDSQNYRDCKAYKICKAYPDGRLELRGTSAELFELEAGMFFYSADIETAKSDFEQMVNLSVKSAPPCRSKVHLAKYSDEKYVVALIYPAEYDNDISRWLLDGDYKTAGPAEGGTEAVQSYYDYRAEILEKQQLFSKTELVSRSGEELLANIKFAVQR